jgi:peptidyl-prolyl cis-trans isomerase D
MALIGTIRKNGWILIAMMTLALGGFILMEIISNAQRNSAGDVNTLGKVNGTEIKRTEFERYMALIYSNADANSAFQVRDQAWKFFSENLLITQEAEKLGLGVGRDELRDLEFGINMSPLIKERYKNSDGTVNMNYLNGVKSAIDGGQFVDQQQFPFRSAWIEQEAEVIKIKLEDKLTTLVSKGMYTPTWQAEMTFRENNERRGFAYVRIPYETIKDEEAQPTDDDFKSFLEENPHLYDQTEETRVVAYVAFNVATTSGDSAASKAAIIKLKEGFASATNDSIYAINNGGTYNKVFKTKTALPVNAADTLLRMPVGAIVGPYLDGDNYTISKILVRKTLPDSVRARHILLKGNNPAFATTLDSLKDLISSGKERFDSLAVKISQDPGSGAKGGDLGYFANGMMVPEFNDVCFNTGEQGKLYITQTQFGYHLIEITGQKFVKNEVGVKTIDIKQRIEPSKNTMQAAKDKAIALVQVTKTVADLTTTAKQAGAIVMSSAPLKSSDYTIDGLGTGADAREIIRWAFGDEAKKDLVSKDIFSFRDANGGYFDNKYVVVGLKNIAKKGKANVATLKSIPEAEQKVRQEKKGTLILKQLGTVTDLTVVAAQYQTKVDSVKSVSMMSSGGEPRVLGAAFFLPTGQISNPAIVGSAGVYVIAPISEKSAVQPPADLTMFKKQVSSSAATTIKTNLVESIKKRADIRDNRGRFY